MGVSTADFDLVRVSIAEAGAFGVLLQAGIPFVVTLERTFERRRVVIPPGEWRCRRTVFRKRGYPTYEVLVPDHERVLIHIGNLEEDSTGCVLLGMEFGELQGRPAVLLSRLAFREFMRRAQARPELRLRVKEAA